MVSIKERIKSAVARTIDRIIEHFEPGFESPAKSAVDPRQQRQRAYSESRTSRSQEAALEFEDRARGEGTEQAHDRRVRGDIEPSEGDFITVAHLGPFKLARTNTKGKGDNRHRRNSTKTVHFRGQSPPPNGNSLSRSEGTVTRPRQSTNDMKWPWKSEGDVSRHDSRGKLQKPRRLSHGNSTSAVDAPAVPPISAQWTNLKRNNAQSSEQPDNIKEQDAAEGEESQHGEKEKRPRPARRRTTSGSRERARLREDAFQKAQDERRHKDRERRKWEKERKERRKQERVEAEGRARKLADEWRQKREAVQNAEADQKVAEKRRREEEKADAEQKRREAADKAKKDEKDKKKHDAENQKKAQEIAKKAEKEKQKREAAEKAEKERREREVAEKTKRDLKEKHAREASEKRKLDAEAERKKHEAAKKAEAEKKRLAEESLTARQAAFGGRGQAVPTRSNRTPDGVTSPRHSREKVAKDNKKDSLRKQQKQPGKRVSESKKGAKPIASPLSEKNVKAQQGNFIDKFGAPTVLERKVGDMTRTYVEGMLPTEELKENLRAEQERERKAAEARKAAETKRAKALEYQTVLARKAGDMTRTVVEGMVEKDASDLAREIKQAADAKRAKTLEYQTVLARKAGDMTRTVVEGMVEKDASDLAREARQAAEAKRAKELEQKTALNRAVGDMTRSYIEGMATAAPRH
ncbi:hypothetical protein EG329_013564 [Mollisiaceae sp. DMI_Dod_QoI]|nr:hypothetical protein EG329_013564 [Helotiales sp. DMI_Dod_QoI]